jgi:hypothetical protein
MRSAVFCCGLPAVSIQAYSCAQGWLDSVCYKCRMHVTNVQPCAIVSTSTADQPAPPSPAWACSPWCVPLAAGRYKTWSISHEWDRAAPSCGPSPFRPRLPWCLHHFFVAKAGCATWLWRPQVAALGMQPRCALAATPRLWLPGPCCLHSLTPGCGRCPLIGLM